MAQPPRPRPAESLPGVEVVRTGRRTATRGPGEDLTVTSAPDVAPTLPRGLPRAVLDPARSPARSSTPSPAPSLAGRHVIMVGLGHQVERDGLPEPALALADQLALRSASVTLLSAAASRSRWRRRLGGRPSVPRLLRLDHVPGTPRDGGSVAAAATEATRLITAAGAALPGPLGFLVAVTPGLGGLVAAARVAHRQHVPLLVLVTDLVTLATGDDTPAAAAERQALALADAVALTRAEFLDPVLAAGVPAHRVAVLPPAFVTDRAQARSLLGLPPRSRVVLAPQQGAVLTPVLEAARALGRRRDLRVVAVGEPRRPSRRTAGLTYVDSLDLALAAADLVVLCEADGASAAGTPPAPTAGHDVLALTERAFALGHPVVAMAGRGGPLARRLAGAAGAGVLLPPGDGTELARTIERLIAQESLLELMGARARQQAPTVSLIDSLVRTALAP